MRPPAKVKMPQGEEQEEEPEEEEQRAGGGERGEGQALWLGTGSHIFPLFLVSAVTSSSPGSEEATDTRWGQSYTGG